MNEQMRGRPTPVFDALTATDEARDAYRGLALGGDSRRLRCAWFHRICDAVRFAEMNGADPLPVLRDGVLAMETSLDKAHDMLFQYLSATVAPIILPAVDRSAPTDDASKPDVLKAQPS